ncbi:MAG: hypothetical protein ACUVRZ_02325 [Desulfobacca sp.]|uniref:hypothetical protein n=1 Tax=Desulfobacca sp. TaxID=2067990 RepID=UPI004049AB32
MPQKSTRLLLLLLALTVILTACGQQGPSEQDIVGRWENTSLPDLWMEFKPDKTCSGGTWALTKEGVKVINADGTEHQAVFKEGKLIFTEFGQHGEFIKESKK